MESEQTIEGVQLPLMSAAHSQSVQSVQCRLRPLMARARVMKTKKQFCPKTNVFKRKKLHAAASELPVVAVKVRGWRFIDNVKSLQQKTSPSSLEESFHNAIKPVLVIAQLFGVLPVTNVMDVHPVSMQFVWKSVRFFWSLITTISCGLMMLLTCYWTFSKRVEFGKMVPLMFYLLTLSLIEHLLSMVSSFALVIDCPRINNIMKAYYVKSFPQVFNYFPYSVAFSVYIKLIHVTSTFIWTFTDLFIMMVSCGLSEKFKLINERMLEEKGKVGEINLAPLDVD
jgi:hypothetical protein